MGADGGVCWMRLRDPARYQRLCELLRPFWWLTSSGEADWQAEASDAFLDANDYGAPAYLVGRYGTSQDFSIYEDLECVLGDTEEDVAADASLTFAELVEDLQTRTCWPDPLTKRAYGRRALDYHDAHTGRRVSMLEAWVWDVVHLYLDQPEKVAEQLEPIGGMTIADWWAEVRSIVDGRAGWEETWT